MTTVREGQGLTVPVLFEGGVAPMAAFWSLSSAADLLVPRQSIQTAAPAGYSVATASDRYTFTIPASAHTLAAGAVRDVRVLLVDLVYASGNVSRRAFWFVESQTLLVPLVNSFQSYEQILLLSADMPGVDTFLTTDLSVQVAALTEAYGRLRQLTYTTTCDDDVDQSHWRTEGRRRIRLDHYELADFRQLPERFLTALYRAQLAEAAQIFAGGDAALDDSEARLLSRTVGEARDVYRQGASKALSLTMPISGAALRYIRGFVVWAPRLTRA